MLNTCRGISVFCVVSLTFIVSLLSCSAAAAGGSQRHLRRLWQPPAAAAAAAAAVLTCRKQLPGGTLLARPPWCPPCTALAHTLFLRLSNWNMQWVGNLQPCMNETDPAPVRLLHTARSRPRWQLPPDRTSKRTPPATCRPRMLPGSPQLPRRHLPRPGPAAGRSRQLQRHPPPMVC